MRACSGDLRSCVLAAAAAGVPARQAALRFGVGVTAWIDIALATVARLRGEDYARTIPLMSGYAPQPPFHAGTSAEAGPGITRVLSDILVDDRAQVLANLMQSAPGAG